MKRNRNEVIKQTTGLHQRSVRPSVGYSGDLYQILQVATNLGSLPTELNLTVLLSEIQRAKEYQSGDPVIFTQMLPKEFKECVLRF